MIHRRAIVLALFYDLSMLLFVCLLAVVCFYMGFR